jgi:hypothetical protein
MLRVVLIGLLLAAAVFTGACSNNGEPQPVEEEVVPQEDRKPDELDDDALESLFEMHYSLDDQSMGVGEVVDNIYNFTIVARDENIFRAEYKAGYIQSSLQGKMITSARDNTWDSLFLLDPSHSFPTRIPPSEEDLELAAQLLLENYQYTLDFIESLENRDQKNNFKRLLFRLLGIYHGTGVSEPADLDFSGEWLPALDYFAADELKLGYETSTMTWLDLYFINAFMDLSDDLAFSDASVARAYQTRCSAFVKKLDDDVIITHNTWYSYLNQSHALNLAVNDDIMVVNAVFPGILASNTDFGYNNKGILFNETTHRATYSASRVDALWSFWRAAAAEQFASSIEEFFEYISIDTSGTYMNGYMVVDAKSGDLGLVEISHQSFIFFFPHEQGYRVESKPEGRNLDYDRELVTESYILGINYPASYQIRDDLQAADNRPARRRQFLEMIDSVVDVETAKELITYTEPGNPLSIYGRWDLGYGETDSPKTIPDGSIDAKAVLASAALELMSFEGRFDHLSTNKSFWMRYGTPHVEGEPFTWSSSQWGNQKLRHVPDRVDGAFNLLNLYLE